MKVTRRAKVVLAVLAVALVAACGKEPESSGRGGAPKSAGGVSQADLAAQALVLRSINPRSLKAGKGYNVQADGSSAIELNVEAARLGTVATMDGTPLLTFYGSEKFLTASVPRALFASPGTFKIAVVDGDRKSNPVDLTIDP